MNEKTEADTICRTCLRLWQGFCDGEKVQTACPSYKRMTGTPERKEIYGSTYNKKEATK